MNAVTIFLTIGAIYLAIVAYGVVGTRKRGLPPQLRLMAAAIQVVLPPTIFFGIMFLDRDLFPVAAWGPVLAMLMLAGALLAICTDIVARRVL
jgi:hypothetical protein